MVAGFCIGAGGRCDRVRGRRVSGHDPLCPVEDYSVPYLCLCELIEMVRADERERIYGDMKVTKDDIQLLLRDERERIAQALRDLGYDYPAEVARNGREDTRR